MTDSMDFGAILQQAQEMQSQMMNAQAEQAKVTLQGTGGGDKVIVTVDGNGEYKGIKISPEVVDSSDVEMLEDLVMTALKDATQKVSELQMKAIDNLGIPDLVGDMPELPDTPPSSPTTGTTSGAFGDSTPGGA